MAEINNGATGNENEAKKSFGARVKEAAGNFSEKHPKITKAISTTIKVGAGVGIGVVAAVIGSKVKNSRSEDDIQLIDLNDVEPFDEDVIEALDDNE